MHPHPSEEELVVIRMSLHESVEADQISLAETVSCATSSLEGDESRPCNACPHCDDVCESPDCRPCVGKRKRSRSSADGPGPVDGGSTVDRVQQSHTRSNHHGGWGQPPSPKVRYYTPCQVKRHVHADSCWLVAGDTIYDATPFLKTHPGGSTCILRSAGGRKDCTKDITLHSKRAQLIWKNNIVGKVRPCGCSNQHQQQQQQASTTEERPWWMIWQ